MCKALPCGALVQYGAGQRLERIYKHSGYNTIKSTILVIGNPFGKLISAYKRWINEEALSRSR